MTQLTTVPSRAKEILNKFENVHKTEAQFYLLFQKLEIEDIEYLMSFYNVKNQWEVFSRICKFYDVKS